jgi:hypothetical protein
MAILAKGAIYEEMGWVGGWVSTKRLCFDMAKLKTHVKQLKSINCSKIHLWVPSKMFGMTMVAIWKPMACSLSSTLNFPY